MSKEAISIVVPTYEEAENIPILTQRVFAALREAGVEGELIVVDDDSQDRTVGVVEELSASYPIRLIVRKGERGLSSAVLRGFAEAKNDILLCMDADLSHPPETIPWMHQLIVRNEAEFVLGSRYVAGGATTEDWSVWRKINSQVATLLARPITPVRDPMSGFFCLRRETLERARSAGINPIGYKIGLELMIRARCSRIREVPILFAERQRGESKLNLRQQLLYLKHLVTLYRFQSPIRYGLILLGIFLIIVVGAWSLFLRLS